jgi:hypothetical protein
MGSSSWGAVVGRDKTINAFRAPLGLVVNGRLRLENHIYAFYHSGQLSILHMENVMENVTWSKHITTIPRTVLNTLCLHFPDIL